MCIYAGLSVFPRRLVPLSFILALIAALGLLPAGASASSGAKKCPRGKKLVVVKKKGKVVKKNGKVVKKCVKKAAATPAPAPTPSPAAPTGLFEAPGKTLEGKDTLPFL